MDWSIRSFRPSNKGIIKKTVLAFLLVTSLFFTFVPILAVHAQVTADGVPTGQGLTPEECAKFPTICTPGRSEDIRTVVITIVNYLLTFLGLVAVVVIIYAGFRVVALAGNEAEVKKAQKTIVYTAVGIIIILIAYAIVNFVINVVTGNVPPPGNSVTNTSSSGGPSSGTGSSSGGTSGSSSGTGSTSSGGSTGGSGGGGTTAPATTTINNIYNTVNNPPADTARLESEISRLSSELTKSINQLPATLQTLTAAELQAVLTALEKFKTNPSVQNNDDLKKALQDLQKTLDENNAAVSDSGNPGTATSSNTSDTLEKLLNQMLSELSALKNPNDFKVVVEKNKEQLQTIVNQLPPNPDTLVVVKKLQDALDKLANQPNSAQNAQEVSNAVQQLKAQVAKLPQMRAAITASKSSGPVPLTVSFNGTTSNDPTGNTIPSANYNWWYLDSSGSRVNLGSGPIVSETFRSPNSYIVHLQVKSASGDTTVLPGEATITIRAEAPLASVKLKLNQTDVTEQDSFKVTLQDAQTGLAFDPAGTTTTTGLNIEKTEWDFGDGSQRQVIDGNITSISHKFNKIGRYRVNVTFTDSGKQKFNKILNLEVADAIADATVSPTEGTTDTSFRLSANASKIPSGVRLLTWKLTAPNGDVLRETKEDTFSYKFDQPGLYTALLEITDNDGKTVQDTKQIKVSSKPPVVKFTLKQKDAGHPNTYLLDASSSYDPDQGETLTYAWLVDGREVPLAVPNEDKSRGEYTFSEKKEYRVKVRVSDPSLNVIEKEQTVTIDSVLSADIQIEPVVTQVGKDITVAVTSSGGQFYIYDFGEKKIQTDSPKTTYRFSKAGVYRVKVTVADKDNNEIMATAPVFVGEADSPVAMLDYDLNGETLPLEPGVCGENEGIVISRADNLRFDSSRSINKDGATRFLDYSWNFGDNTVSTKKTINHKFSDVSASCYKVQLTVTDRDSGKNALSQPLYVLVRNKLPVLQDLIVDAPASLITPVQVNVRAVGAIDRDGRIVTYRWYYYEDGTDQNLDVRTTTTPATTFNIPTRGFGGQQVQYHFVVELTDNDNESVSSEDLLGNGLGLLTVTNRSNDPLQIEVTANKTSVKAGEAIQFTALPRTSKGEVVNDAKVVWDFDGDGTFEDNFSGSYATKVYDKPGNYTVTARVEYQGLSSRGTTSVLINPRSDTTTTSAFVFTAVDKTVLFSNNSKGTPPLSYEWDFDLSRDSDGDGNNQNDIDSKDENPQHTYDDYGTYQVRLVAKGTNGARDDVIRSVVLQKGVLPKGVVIDPAKSLQAVLITVPEANQLDNKVHLTRDRNKMTLFAGYSVGKIKEYRIDKNIFSDSDGDGIKDNDVDNKGTLSFSNGSSIVYSFAPEPTTVRLTVFGDNNATDAVSVPVVFDDAVPAAQNQNQNTNVPTKTEVLENKTKETLNSITQSPLSKDVQAKIQELFAKGDKEALEQVKTLLQVDSVLTEDAKKQLIGKIQDIIDLKGTFVDIDSSIQRIKSIIAEAEPLTKIKINKALLALKANYGFDNQKIGSAIAEIKQALDESLKLTPDLKEQVSNVLDRIADSLTTPPSNQNQNVNTNENSNLNENASADQNNNLNAPAAPVNENQNAVVEQPAQPQGNNIFLSLLFGILGIVLWIIGIFLFLGIVLFVSFMVYKRVANREDLDFEEYILDLRGMLTGFFQRFIPGKKEESVSEIAAPVPPKPQETEKSVTENKNISPISEIVPEPAEGEATEVTNTSTGPMPDWLNLDQPTDTTISSTASQDIPSTPSFLDNTFNQTQSSESPFSDQNTPFQTTSTSPVPDFLTGTDTPSTSPTPSFLDDAKAPDPFAPISTADNLPTPNSELATSGPNPFDVDIFGDNKSPSSSQTSQDSKPFDPFAPTFQDAPLQTPNSDLPASPPNPFDIDIFGDSKAPSSDDKPNDPFAPITNTDDLQTPNSDPPTPAPNPFDIDIFGDTSKASNPQTTAPDPFAPVSNDATLPTPNSDLPASPDDDLFTPFTPRPQAPASAQTTPSFLPQETSPDALPPLPDFLADPTPANDHPIPDFLTGTDTVEASKSTLADSSNPFDTTTVPQAPESRSSSTPKTIEPDFSIPEIKAPEAEEQLPPAPPLTQLSSKAGESKQPSSQQSSSFKPNPGFPKKPFKPGQKPFYKKKKFYYNDRKRPPFKNDGTKPNSTNPPKDGGQGQV